MIHLLVASDEGKLYLLSGSVSSESYQLVQVSLVHYDNLCYCALEAYQKLQNMPTQCKLAFLSVTNEKLQEELNFDEASIWELVIGYKIFNIVVVES